MTDLIERLRDIAHYIETDVIGGSEPASTVREAVAEILRLRAEIDPPLTEAERKTLRNA